MFKKFPPKKLLLVVILLVVPALLGWFYSEGAIEATAFVLMAVISLGLAGGNIADQQAQNKKRALREVELARERMEKGQFRSALNRLEEALLYDPECFEVRVARGEIYRTQRSFELARRELIQALELRPDSYSAHFALGLTYLEEMKVYEAISEFRRAISLNPSRSEPHFILAQAYELSGEKQKALECYKRYLEVVKRDLSAGSKASEYIARARQRVRALK